MNEPTEMDVAQCFHENVEALSRQDPALAKLLSHAEWDPYSVTLNKDGFPVTGRGGGTAWRPLGNFDDPIGQGRNVAVQMWNGYLEYESQVLQKMGVKEGLLNHPILWAGMGCPYTLSELIRAEPYMEDNKKRRYMVVENDHRLLGTALHCVDFSRAIRKGQLRFFVGTDALIKFEDYLQKQVWMLLPLFPLTLKGNEWTERITEVMLRAGHERESNKFISTERLAAQQKQRSDKERAELLRGQGSRPPRVQILSCRFTSFVRYSSEFIAKGLVACGAESNVAMEPTDQDRNSSFALTVAMEQFDPDLVLSIDNRRGDLEVVPEALPYVSWIQDDLAPLLAPGAGDGIGDRELVYYNAIQHGPRLLEVGYPADRTDLLMVPTDPTVFCPLKLTPKHQKKYGAKLAFTHHYFCSSDEGLAMLVGRDSSLKSLFDQTYERARESVIQGATLTHLEVEEIFSEPLEAKQHAWDFYTLVVNRLARELPIRWLVEEGITDLKLYGEGWENSEEFRPYAAGIAEYGEEVNLIYNATQINLNLHPRVTIHQRFFDCAAARCFMLSNALPPGSDGVETFFEGKAQVVTYGDRDDFLQKVHYYLDNPEARLEQIDQLREYVIGHHTYQLAAQKILDRAAALLEKG